MTPHKIALKLALFLCVTSLLMGASNGQESGMAHWIWVAEKPGEVKKGEQRNAYFRHEFDAPANLKRAVLIVSGDDAADVRINGARRPVTSDNWSNPEVATVGDQLVSGGKNLIAVQAKDKSGTGAVLVSLMMETMDGMKTYMVSDGSWKVSKRAEKGWFDLNFTPKATKADWVDATVKAPVGGKPWTSVTPARLTALENVREPQATAVEDLKVAPGFSVELLYSVPKAAQGSWVAMTVDDKGRLIVSDQYGALYRLPVPAAGKTLSHSDIEKINLDIGGAQGLHYVNDALYVVLNTGEHGGRGLYRVTDSNGDDQLDKKELLKKFPESGGEHGPHAVMSNPDGGLTVVIGNQTPLPEIDSSRVPQVWDEDILLERPIGNGFMKGVPAPGGWIATCDLDGKNWELVATGFRNEYDAAYDRNGQLFTYDADMEWDMNLPWYRPTRVNHVVSGAEFGWRSGGAKWPAYYPDSVGAVTDIGPGSPTGVTFGFGAKFPKKYQDAFFISDWSYGKLYAVHMKPDGGSYKADFEEFISAQPFPLTDILVHPDGAMYITIGGRRVQSGLYRVTYSGDEPIGPDKSPALNETAQLRLKLEAFHGKQDPAAVGMALAELGHSDKAVRFAARIALEHQPLANWQDKVLGLTDTDAVINGMIALARHGDAAVQPKILEKLNALDWASLHSPQSKGRQRIDLIRAYAVCFARLGKADEATRAAVASRVDAHFPAKSPALNREILDLLVYLDAPSAAAKGIALLKEAPSQEEQIALAKSLRHLKSGWTRELRADFYRWFTLAGSYKGGNSFAKFLDDMKKTALANTPEADKKALSSIIEAKPEIASPQFTYEAREFVKNWALKDFDGVLSVGLEGNRDYTNGRKMFGAATCFACHRFDQEGGAIGPDLTSVSGKFSPADLLESIIDPGKEISDQYGSMIFTMTDDSTVTGRIMNLSGDSFRVNTNMMDPNDIKSIDRKKIKEMKPSPISMMPPGLLNTLKQEDILDLLAYLLSQGDPENPMFK